MAIEMLMWLASVAAGAGSTVQWISKWHGQLPAGTWTINAIQRQLSTQLSDVTEQQFWSRKSLLHVWWVPCLEDSTLCLKKKFPPVLLLVYFCDQFVVPEIRHSRRHSSVC